MNKTLIAAGLSALAALTAGAAVAQATDGRPGRDADVTRAQVVAQTDARFAKLDANRDGNISAAERTAMRGDRVAERFKRLDLDGNGSVTQAEMQKAHEARGERGEGRRGGRHGGGFSGAGATADADNDGLISKAEFQAGALERFDRGDADRNGILTAAERRQARAAMKAQRPS
jgi:hypothetical protein